LVWKAMLSTTWMMSAILLEASLMWVIVAESACTASALWSVTLRALSARWAACWAMSVLWRMVLVISSIDEAVSSRLLAWASVRAERSWLPSAMTPVSRVICTTPLRASRTMDIRFTLSWARALVR